MFGSIGGATGLRRRRAGTVARMSLVGCTERSHPTFATHPRQGCAQQSGVATPLCGIASGEVPVAHGLMSTFEQHESPNFASTFTSPVTVASYSIKNDISQFNLPCPSLLPSTPTSLLTHRKVWCSLLSTQDSEDPPLGRFPEHGCPAHGHRCVYEQPSDRGLRPRCCDGQCVEHPSSVSFCTTTSTSVANLTESVFCSRLPTTVERPPCTNGE